MRTLSKPVLRGVVEEAYIKFAASQELLKAEQLSSNVNRIREKFPSEIVGKMKLNTVSANLERVKRALKVKAQINEKLKVNWEELNNSESTRPKEELRREKKIQEQQMSDASTELKKATDALRKSSHMNPKELSGVFLTDEKHDSDEDLAELLPTCREMEEIVTDLKVESELIEFSPLQD